VAILKGNDQQAWQELRLIAFDSPAANQQKYEERIELLKTSVPAEHPLVYVVQPVKCESKEHLHHFLTTLQGEGAEGVALRKAESYYYDDLSFFKHKVYLDTLRH
jgi:ATP-dependent DNA ligase